MMDSADARKILGIIPGEDPRVSLPNAMRARANLAKMAAEATDELLAARYRASLDEVDKAMEIIRAEVAVIEAEVAAGTTTPAAPAAKPYRRHKGLALCAMAFFAIATAGGIVYLQRDQVRRLAMTIGLLESKTSVLIENRQWPEATANLDEIERLAPGSVFAAAGRKDIAAGIEEEQNQFIGYWTGESRAAYEAGRWPDAENAARQVLAKFPQEKEAAELLQLIATARQAELRLAALAAARELFNQKKWPETVAATRKILAESPADEGAKALLTQAEAAIAKAAADLAKAQELLEKAISRDQGQYDQQMLDWLREASVLAPEDLEIKAFLEKVSTYVRTFRVPGDYPTLAAALADSRDRDRILVAAGSWKGPLSINASVDLQGIDPATTIVECPAENGSAITFGPGAKGTRIAGITFRHESFDASPSRYSAALVRGGQVEFVDCRFLDASGHGLAVIEAGRATIVRCRFSGNGWNGLAASGKGSSIESRGSEYLGNFGHGIEAWDDTSVSLVENRCEENTRNGVHADCGTGTLIIEDNQFVANREFGLYVGSAASGKVTRNTARENLLGGILVRKAGGTVAVASNQATHNQGPGIALEKGLPNNPFSNNTLTGNSGQQLVFGLVLDDKDTGEENETSKVPIAPAPPASEVPQP